MSTLRLIGYWRSDHEPEWSDVREFVDPTSETEERMLVVAYLGSGVDTPWSYVGPRPRSASVVPWVPLCETPGTLKRDRA